MWSDYEAQGLDLSIRLWSGHLVVLACHLVLGVAAMLHCEHY